MRPFPVALDESLAEGFCRHMISLAEEGGAKEESVQLLGRVARAISRATSSGHTCLLLNELLGTNDNDSLQAARRLLLASGLLATDSHPTPLPLVLDGDNRLYLGRYFDYERRLAAMLVSRAARENRSTAVDDDDAKRLDLVFHSSHARTEGQADWQKLAAALALRNQLTIITGGPGTGKTTTVVNLLACLLSKKPTLRIALAAPTGKAAQRMQDAIRERASHLPEGIRELLPKDSFTIHRLLGVIPDSHLFRHHAENLLALDVLIIDEASMLDLALATKLLAALPDEAKLILLGDKDQLAAVEAGAVFSELCANPTISEPCRKQLVTLTGIAPELITPPAVKEPLPLQDVVIWLTENYRFGKGTGIGKLATGINNQDAEAVLACLRDREERGVQWFHEGGIQLDQEALRQLEAGFDSYRLSLSEQGGSPAAIFEALGRFRILCAVRDSERGVEWLNRHISTTFRAQLNHSFDDGLTQWYPGRPVMILKNDYVLKLFNGDIGVILPDAGGKLTTYFPTSQGQFRLIDPIRLPPHETAFAMTVHKSQGSEFEKVAVVLPAFTSTVLTKELIYTAITRARQMVTLYSPESVLREAIARKCARHSGLISRLQTALPLRCPSLTAQLKKPNR